MLCCEWDDDILISICDMFEKTELEGEVVGLRQKNEKLQTNLNELQQWRDDLLKEARKRTKRRQQHNNESIIMMVEDLKHIFVLLAVSHLMTFCWVIAVLVLVGWICWCKLQNETHEERVKKFDTSYDDVEDDKLTAALDMSEKDDLVMKVDKLREKKEIMEKEIRMMTEKLVELQQQRDNFLDPAKKLITSEQHSQTLETIDKLVEGVQALCFLFVLFCLLTWYLVFAIFAVMACICWYFLEKLRGRLEAENSVHEMNEKLKSMESHYAELEKTHAELQKAGVDIANNVDEAKVTVSIGKVQIEVGKGSIVDAQGYGMKIANRAKVADVKVKYEDVTWKLGEGVKVKTKGGEICLDAEGNVSVNAKADSQTIIMGDHSTLKVQGADITSTEKNATINKGAVLIQMGKNARLEIKGALLKTSGPLNNRKEDNTILRLRIDDNEIEEVEGELIVIEAPRICTRCYSQSIDMKLKDKLIIFDLKGQHNLRTCVGVCRDCKGRENDDSYYKKQGFWPIERSGFYYLIDVDLLFAFKDTREKYKDWHWNHSCKCSLLPTACHQRWVNESADYFTRVLGNVFKKKSCMAEPAETFTSVFLAAFDQFIDTSEGNQIVNVLVQSTRAYSNVGTSGVDFVRKEIVPETPSCTVI